MLAVPAMAENTTTAAKATDKTIAAEVPASLPEARQASQPISGENAADNKVNLKQTASSTVNTSAPANPTPYLTSDALKTSLEASYSINPRIKAERESLKAVNEGVAQAHSGWRPSVTAEYDRGRQRTKFGTTRNSGRWNSSDSETQQLSVSQPLFRGGETVARVRSARLLVNAARERLRSVEQEILLNTIVAYIDVVQNESVLELSRNNVKVLGEQLKATKERFDVGEVTLTDVAQSEARYSRAQSEAIQAEGDLESSRAVYRRLVGKEPTGLSMPVVSSIPLPATLEEAKSVALENNPNLRSITFQRLSAEKDISVRKAALLPNLSLNANARREDGTGVTGTDQFDEDSVTLNLRIPIYQQGLEYSRIREAKNTAQRRNFEELDTKDDINESLTRAWERLQTSRATIAATEDSIRAAEIALEGVKQEQQYGARTTLDVLDAEQELFIAKVNLIRAKRNEVVAIYNLLAVAGQLTADKLALNVAIYDPTEAYENTEYKFIGF